MKLFEGTLEEFLLKEIGAKKKAGNYNDEFGLTVNNIDGDLFIKGEYMPEVYHLNTVEDIVFFSNIYGAAGLDTDEIGAKQ